MARLPRLLDHEAQNPPHACRRASRDQDGAGPAATIQQFDERRLTRDASTAEFYESLFGAEDEDDALTKRRGGSFLKKEPVTPLSPTPPKTNYF